LKGWHPRKIKYDWSEEKPVVTLISAPCKKNYINPGIELLKRDCTCEGGALEPFEQTNGKVALRSR
jgi:hypothetical protein